MEGLIIKLISGDYTCLLEDGDIRVCKPIGLFRLKKIDLKVGDKVIVENNSITDIKKRKNELIRPNIANVDKAFIITSLVEPEINLNLLDRLIANIEYNNIEAILLFSKVDLVNDLDKYQYIFDYYKRIGYKVYLLPLEKDLIKEEIKSSISVLVGQSGVGKSTMLNLFSNLNLKTDTISKALGRGKHTTRHTELINVCGGYVADTPGFGNLDFEMDEVTLSHNFKEFFGQSCKYNGCLHLNEPGCIVKEKVNNGEILKSRYDNYVLFINEIRQKKEKGYKEKAFQTKGYHSKKSNEKDKKK